MRKLAISSAAFSSAVMISAFFLNDRWRFALILSAVFLFPGVICFFGGKKTRWKVLRLVFFSMAAGFLAFGVSCRRTFAAARAFSGAEREIQVVLADYPEQRGNYIRSEGKIISPNCPNLRTVIYDYSPGSALSSAQPGQEVSFTASVKSADTRYGEDYDYYRSVGVYFISTVKSDVTAGNIRRPLGSVPVRLRHGILQKIDSLYASDTAPFMKSLLMGEKSELYEDDLLSISLNRAGLMHIVAVSGMHISFLIGFLRLLLGNSKRTSVRCLIILWGFVLVSGGSPSAVRAAIMQSILLMAPVFRHENDSLTSLSFALALILLADPFAALSVSLQLSFAAMAGIILFAERLYLYLSRCLEFISRFRLGKVLLGGVASSFSVMALTLPLTAAHFGSVQLLSVFSNLLVLWAVSLCFCGGYLSLAAGVFSLSAGKLIAAGAGFFARYIFRVSALISSLDFAVVYISSIFAVLWLIIVYIFFLTAYFSRWSDLSRLLWPCAFSLLTLGILFFVSQMADSSHQGIITALDVGQGQCVAVFCGDVTAVADCGGTNSFNAAGETAGEYLLSSGRKKIDVLVLSHLHEDHANGVDRLLSYVRCGVILTPSYPPDDPEYLALLQCAEKHHVPVQPLSEDRTFSFGELRLACYPPEAPGSANENCMGTVISIGDYDAVFTGDMSGEDELKFLEKSRLSDAELLIAGHHGSKYSSTGEFLSAIGADTAVISCGYNTYGHPTGETLSRLSGYGYQIYRTDLNGNVRVIIN